MCSSRLIRLVRLDRLDRRDDVSDRAVALAFTARFTDEALSGGWTVLAPTFRRVFGLSLVQVGLLSQVLSWVALAVEPVAAGMIDLRSRRTMLIAGALALAASMLVMGTAPTYPLLLCAFALYGLGSGPLAHTADVVVVETFPTAAERAYSRATLLDTLGAMLGPALIAAAGAVGVSWRIVLVGLGLATLGYAAASARTRFPDPRRAVLARQRIITTLVANARVVLRTPRARRLLLVLLWFDLFESAFVLKYVWLHDSVGLSEPLVATYAAGEQVVDLVALVVLDRWLATRTPVQVLSAASTVLIVLPAAWVLAPGVGGRVLLGAPLAFAHTLIWPLAKAQSLTAVPQLAGATQAITTLFPLIPLAVLQAALASTIGTGTAMAATAGLGAVLMVVTVLTGDGRLRPA